MSDLQNLLHGPAQGFVLLKGSLTCKAIKDNFDINILHRNQVELE